MQIKYYETAWKDISNSPGWFGKLCLLALVNFIPIFGQIVTFGYLYGWAREISWGLHAPMPARIMNNDDGKFWRRGWFALVIVVAFAIVPSLVSSFGQGLSIAASYGTDGNGVLAPLGSLVYLIGMALSLLMSILAWIGIMRSSIYDRLSAGFQFGKIWKMFRRDTGGILRIFGMELLVGIILGIILSIVISVLMFFVLFAGVAGVMSAGYSPETMRYMTESQAAQFLLQFMTSAGLVGVVCILAAAFLSFLANVFINALVVRAVGYWVMQFDVPHWKGQDEPLPFEVVMGGGQPASYADGAAGVASAAGTAGAGPAPASVPGAVGGVVQGGAILGMGAAEPVNVTAQQAGDAVMPVAAAAAATAAGVSAGGAQVVSAAEPVAAAAAVAEPVAAAAAGPAPTPFSPETAEVVQPVATAGFAGAPQFAGAAVVADGGKPVVESGVANATAPVAATGLAGSAEPAATNGFAGTVEPATASGFAEAADSAGTSDGAEFGTPMAANVVEPVAARGVTETADSTMVGGAVENAAPAATGGAAESPASAASVVDYVATGGVSEVVEPVATASSDAAASVSAPASSEGKSILDAAQADVNAAFASGFETPVAKDVVSGVGLENPEASDNDGEGAR